MNAKVTKKNYRKKYQQAKASVIYTATTPVTTGDATGTNSTPSITIITAATALKGLR